jgi:hypothetical protein
MRAFLALFLIVPSLALADNGVSHGPSDPDVPGDIEETPFGDAWSAGDLAFRLPEEPGFVDTFCDVVLNPDPKAGTSAPRMREGMSVCVLPGTFGSGLRLDTPGVRVVALEPGTVMVQGDVVVVSPAVVVGLAIHGNLLVHASARGTVLIGNSVQGAGASAAKGIVLAGNTVGGNGKFATLGENVDPALHLPDSAPSLRVTIPFGSLVVDHEAAGDAAGWVVMRSLQPAAPPSRSSKGPQAGRTSLRPGLPTAKTGGAWSTQDPPGVDIQARMENWMPVYGTISKQDEPAVVIPLEVGPWGPYSAGVVVTTN